MRSLVVNKFLSTCSILAIYQLACIIISVKRHVYYRLFGITDHNSINEFLLVFCYMPSIWEIKYKYSLWMEHQCVSIFRIINTCISDGLKFSVLIGTYIKCTINCIWSHHLYDSNTLLHLCYRAYNSTSVSVGLFHFALEVQHKLSFMWFLHFLLLKKNPILKCLFVSGVLPICLLVCFLPPPKNINIKEMLTLNVWEKNPTIMVHQFLESFYCLPPSVDTS